jgi:hypothetical protein
MRVYLLMCRVKTMNSLCAHYFHGVISNIPLYGDGENKSNCDNYCYRNSV